MKRNRKRSTVGNGHPIRIGVVMGTDTAFNRSIIMGAIRAARQRGVYLVRQSPAHFAASDVRHTLDAILTLCYSETEADKLLALGVPVVNASSSELKLPLPRIVSHDTQVGRLAADHLLERHYHHIAFVGYMGRGFSERRRLGFRERLAEQGMSCHEPPETTGSRDPRFLKWLTGLPRPLAIFCANDTRARQVATYAEEVGLRVPEDFAILGVDNDPFECEAAGLPISSVEIAGERIGELGIEHLLVAVREEKALAPELLVPPIRVIARRSTEFTATADHEVGLALAEIHRAVQSGERPRIDRIADRVFVARRTLERRFRKELGRSVRQEIERVAINRATHLLLETDWPVKLVASKCGYREPRRFSEAFNRIHSMTATSYREQHARARG